MVEMKRQCVEHMNMLRDYENGTLRTPVPRNVQLSAESQNLSSVIYNYGDLVITSGNDFFFNPLLLIEVKQNQIKKFRIFS